jgi:hypothetical protein
MIIPFAGLWMLGRTVEGTTATLGRTTVVLAYLDRLMARPSYARALEEATPFFHLLPR